MWSDAGDQGFEIGLSEAVEEEVSDYEIVLFRIGGIEGEGLDLVGLEACCVRFATFAQEMEHGGAGVDGIGLEIGVLGEELGQEAAVSVAQDEGSFLLGEGRQVVEACSFERSTEGEVFEVTIGVSYAIEAGNFAIDGGHG